MAIRELEQYRYLLSARANCKDRIVELEETMYRLQSAKTDDVSVQSSLNSDQRICSLLDAKEEQIWRLSSIDLKLTRFKRAMETLSDEDRSVLRLCFVEKAETPEEAAWQLGIEKSCLYKKRNRALVRFTKALFGITDDIV